MAKAGFGPEHAFATEPQPVLQRRLPKHTSAFTTPTRFVKADVAPRLEFADGVAETSGAERKSLQLRSAVHAPSAAPYQGRPNRQ
ncbi:hypothetical protein EDD90_0200 [Streptomyces sp. Ag109_O5-1]|nr:hypothetical protein EDD90_0200 [Streptomyces sp. Ag109_O5-1]